jgi:hypothetical protein
MRIRYAGAPRIRLHADAHLLGLARIATQFTRYRVPYCAIGGFAAAMYLPRRHPDDIDLIIGTSLQAGEKAHLAIASLALDPRAAAQSPPSPTAPRFLAEGDQFTLRTAYGTLHLLGAHLPAECDRAAIVRRRRWFMVRKHAVAVCGLDDLLRIKQAANHNRDAEDVAELLAKVRRETGSGGWKTGSPHLVIRSQDSCG